MVIKQTEMLVNEYAEIPYKVITSLTTEINYGGRVTDKWDRRTNNALLIPFCNPDVTSVDYRFSPNGIYRSIGAADKAGYMEYLNNLPVNAAPEIFGLHDNAEITCAVNETNTMFATVLSLQPRAASGGGKSRDELLDETAEEILKQAPPPFNLEQVSDKYPTTYTESMNTVLQQECIRYNKVISKVASSLRDVRKGLKGEVVMTAELEEMGTSLFNNQVPEMWAKVAYPSLKPLASWVPDLLKRIHFIQSWYDVGKPPCFWVSGFFFPQAFITGVMQNHARKYQLPIDTITYGYGMYDDPVDSVTEAPSDGAYIYGLYLEGARWDMQTQQLEESRPKELFTDLPIVHLQPIANRKPVRARARACVRACVRAARARPTEDRDTGGHRDTGTPGHRDHGTPGHRDTGGKEQRQRRALAPQASPTSPVAAPLRSLTAPLLCHSAAPCRSTAPVRPRASLL